MIQLDTRLPLGVQSFDLGAVQRNVLAAMQQRAAEQQLDQQNALATAIRDVGGDLYGADPVRRDEAARRLMQAGPQGFQLAAPILQRSRDMNELGIGGVAAPAMPAMPTGAMPPSGTPAAAPVPAAAGGGAPSMTTPVVAPVAAPAGAPGASAGPRPAADPRMPGMPTPDQFARWVQLGAAGNQMAAQLAQTWAPFMRQENNQYSFQTIGGVVYAVNPRNPSDRVALGPSGEASFTYQNIGGTLYAINTRNPNDRRIVGPAGSAQGISVGDAAGVIQRLAPAVANRRATDDQVREYLSALNVFQNRVTEQGTQVVQPLPAYAPPASWVTQVYPNIAFTETPSAANAGPAPAAMPQAVVPGTAAPAPMVPSAQGVPMPQAAPPAPVVPGGTVIPQPPAQPAPGQAGGVIRPPGPNLQGGTLGQIEQNQFNAENALARLNGIEATFRPEFQTFGTRWSNMWASIRERGGQNLSPREQTQLREYTVARAAALENLNQTIKDITGAAMSDGEAQRITATMPNPGTGLFDGDSPTEFRAKLDRATQSVRDAIIRYNWARSRGLDAFSIPLDEVPALVNRRGAEIEQAIRQANPGLNDAAVRQQTRTQLRTELGVR